MTTNKQARDLAVGDVIEVNPRVTVRVDAIRSVTAKQVTLGATYLRCEFSPDRVGQTWAVTYRLRTPVEIER